MEPTFMDFSDALDCAKDGAKIARNGWNGKNIWVAVQRPDEHSKMTQPYLYIEYPVGHPANPNGSRTPWLASQGDLMAEDWFIVSPEVSAQ